MNIHETAAGLLTPAIRKNLPNRILRAVDNAMHVGNLPRALRGTLAEIARFVKQNLPFEPIFPRKELIASRTNTTTKTVFRHLAALKKLGLIETLEQERKSRNGRYCISRIRLTNLGAGLLGFVEMPQDACAEAVAADNADIKDLPDSVASGQSKDPLPETVFHSLPQDKMSCGHTLTEPTNSKHQLPQRTENGLPVDLAWLTGKGVSRAGIFSLMGMATAKHKRLSDIVTVVEERIQPLTSGRLYGYLAALCRGQSDFSAAAATERLRRRSEEAAQAFQRKAAVFRERFKGVALTNKAQTRLILIDRRCAFAQVFNVGKPPATMPLHDLKPMIESVEAGHLVMATLALERSFVAA